ncbi:hypothetical protein RJ639_033890 [Escallonia herrerae]|uniref:Reverse transcriptase Ty1/copia-type domain-containing protein n=1 Tax=Escallonia herrerae TaxID=1293975 RepID=A0AA88WW26_9ASTE|nr:hypothetical protein RJ639_033890 [Escallonia herrerae]
MAKDAETSNPNHLDPTSEYYLSSQANSDPHIRATVSRLNEAKLIWDSLKTRYSIPNRPRIYKLWSDSSMTTHGGASVITYYTKLLGMWDELLTLSHLESCGCPKGTEKMNWYQDLQTYQFLMGLDDKYATLRIQIINMDPFPNIDRVYAMVMQEESHRGIIGSRDTTSAVGFHAQNGPPTARSSGLVSATAGDPDRTPTGRPWCTFCHRVGHTHRRNVIAALVLLRLVRGRGSPAMSQNAVGSSSGPLQASAAATQNNNPSLSQAQAATTSALPGLTPEQMQRLITFLESSPSGTDSLVGKSLPPTHTWLIDSGASHHMTGNLNFFSSIWDIPPSPVGLPDGLQTNAIKAGSVSLADGITLRHVLYVPNLVVNLISVSCLATDANCFVAFSNDICVLQDRTSKSPIGLDKFVPRSRRCVFLGYPPGKKGWRVYDLETNQVFFSRDVKFEETVFPFTTSLGPSPTPATTTFCPAWDCVEHPMASPPVIGGDTPPVTGGDPSPSPAATPSPGLSGITAGPDPEISSSASPPSSPTASSPTLGRGKRQKKVPSILKDYSPRNWFAKLSTALRSYGFLQSHADHTLFTYRKGDVFLSVLVYVDDLILAGNNSTACSLFKKYLNDCFKLKDLGPLKYFLGIEAARGSRASFSLSANMHWISSLNPIYLHLSPLCSLWNRTTVLLLLAVLSFPTQDHIGDSLVALSTSSSLGLTFAMRSMSCPSSCSLLVPNIGTPHFGFYGILKPPRAKACFCRLIVLFRSMPFVTWTGPAAHSLGIPLPDILFPWEIPPFHGVPRNSYSFSIIC